MLRCEATSFDRSGRKRLHHRRKGGTYEFLAKEGHRGQDKRYTLSSSSRPSSALQDSKLKDMDGEDDADKSLAVITTALVTTAKKMKADD